MYMYLIIGAPGQGKSPWAQKMIEGRQCFVWDINNEYGTTTKYDGQTPIMLSTDPKAARSRYIGWDMKQFVQLAMSRRNTVVVAEEATGFFRGHLSSPAARLAISRKHSGNILLFLFHSINRVPPEIMEMADWVVLFKTNDEEKTIEKKYPRLLEAYRKAQSFQPGQCEIIKMI